MMQSFLLALLLVAVANPVQAASSSSIRTATVAGTEGKAVIKAVKKPIEILLANNDDEVLQIVKNEEDDLAAEKESFLRAVAANSNPDNQEQQERELWGTLGDCQADCDRDSDCKSNSFCYQRRTHSPIPPCCVGNKPPDSRDYCVPVGCSAPSPTMPTTPAPVAPTMPTPATPRPTRAPNPESQDFSVSIDINIPDINIPDINIPENSCFSGDVVVNVLGKGKVAMANLMIGDRILSSNGQYQPVYSFGHYDPTAKGNFLVFDTDNKERSKLEITGEHLIFVQGKSAPVRAETLVVGDKLTPSGATITKISSVTKAGLYAPLTPDATFLVNGHQVSSYAALVQYDTKSEYVQLQNGRSLPISQQDGIHMVLAPFRMWCTNSWLASAAVCDSYNESGMPGYILNGINILTWTNKRSTLFQVSFFIVAFPIFGALIVLEQIQQQWYAFLALVSLLMVGKKMMTSSGLRIKVKAL